jgi:FdhD protein
LKRSKRDVLTIEITEVRGRRAIAFRPPAESSSGIEDMEKLFTFQKGRLEPLESDIVNEFPLKLIVNGREIATLIASPHDLRFLVAGFLRLQGFVDSVADFHMLSVCDDFGVANVRIKGEIPGELRPVMTSGCGTGVVFNLERSDGKKNDQSGAVVFRPEAVFRLMEGLARRAEGYKSHGGMHSAAVGDVDGNLILYAEDLGRHNTLDRIAGEALLKGINLEGTFLVTSGRVSTEMAAKAAKVGVVLIASRTSPTDMAVRICRDAGIALIGYVRGSKFIIYNGAEGIDLSDSEGKIKGVTGVILAGGKSNRMGSNKALLPYRGGRFIEAIYRQFAEIFPEVLVVTNNPEQYEFLPCRKVPDIFPGVGSLAGIHSGLFHSSNPAVFTVACDMPYLNSDLIRNLAMQADPDGVVIPESPDGLEPLHAVYGKGCLEAMESSLKGGEKRIVSFFHNVHIKRIRADQISSLDGSFFSFSNINTPEEYFRLREDERHFVTAGEAGKSLSTASMS